MTQETAATSGFGPDKADIPKLIEPSIRTALPHYLPLGIFPLIVAAAIYGGWWLLPPFLFFAAATPLDRALGLDGRNMDPAKAPARRLLWHNLPVWAWAFLWPPTLILGLWRILVADPSFAIWEDILLAIMLTMEAQAVFIVGHELVHRRTPWERRMGEFLLSSASYPQYATEHVYVHHAEVGTPHDVGSAPKGVSFWQYFPREIVSNLTNSWEVAGKLLARRRLPVWHYSNPFWRYGLYMAFWFGLVFLMGGAWAVVVFAALGFSCVFSMKISNYMQHYGLRRVRLPNGRWEKVAPRHSWSADWKFSNWMFFNMQRHADHHALASRQYPLLQINSPDESPHLPGTYSDMMNVVLRPKRWFEKMDPLVDQWREHFYPDIDDWSAYDSPVSAARPEALDAIIEIFACAPRLARWIERNPELLDNLQEQEFTDLDLPKGFVADAEIESIARRGLARVYWTLDMSVEEMKGLIAEIPAADAKETAEVVRNWSNDKAFQIGMHVVRRNLSLAEARAALSNLAEASILSVLSAVVADSADRRGPLREGGAAAIFLGNLASREVHPGAAPELLFVHDGPETSENARLCERFRKTLAGLTHNSLLFSNMPRGPGSCRVLPLGGLGEHCGSVDAEQIPDLSRARCVFEAGDSQISARFSEARREVLADCAANQALIAKLRQPPTDSAETGVFAFLGMRGGLDDIERAARFVQLTTAGDDIGDSAPGAAKVFAANQPLAHAAGTWRDLQGVLRLIGEEGFDAETAGPKVKSLIAGACGHEDFDALSSELAETASRAAAEIDTLLKRA